MIETLEPTSIHSAHPSSVLVERCRSRMLDMHTDLSFAWSNSGSDKHCGLHIVLLYSPWPDVAGANAFELGSA